ncbi:MAG: hypothetical protein Ctma_0639 [Catillopecten margaritatus gill symbiont]|uniref:CDP-glycerol--glycerophosphate glycerophosphotransferase n=1 Tax=Catillopecten margaritatus gill symbiont TaxID=3083288 RepID=A0AAU6PG11_9GAMM
MWSKKEIIIIASIILFLPLPVFAYLDPGSGSMLLYFLIGIFATFIYSMKNIYFRVKVFVHRLFSKHQVKLADKKNIVFYSEGGHYWTTFKPVIEQLSKMGVKCSYYTSDKRDKGLNFKASNVDTLFIGDGRFSLMSLNYLKAKILVITTPQLDVMHLKRSKTVDYFVHLVHAPTDVFNYKPFAFDFFDCVMCSGQHQIDNLRLIEKVRKTPAKKLLKTGLVYFDELLKHKITVKQNQQKTVLVAPTWGEIGLLNKVGFKPLQLLLEAGFQVILRPHPQSFVNDIELMQEIEIKCNQFDLITIDKSPDAQNSMQQADIMVSDVSGIIFDFAFVYEKPIVAFSDILNEHHLLEIIEINATQKNMTTIWETEEISKIATKINIEQVSDLPNLVNQALDNDFMNNIQILRSKSLFNYGFAGKVAAEQIQSLLNEGHPEVSEGKL